jgi:glycosyltransferase involved in cell wall biosynthesis
LDLSVIIPSYNSAAWVADAISSVLRQTKAPRAIIVVDDGSTDESQAILATFGRSIQVIRQENGGLSAARNAGALAASTEWVAFLDADDRYRPNCIETYAALEAAFPQTNVLFSDFAVFGDEGPMSESAFDRFLPDLDRRARQQAGVLLWLKKSSNGVLIERNGTFAPSALVIRRSLLEQVGWFDEGFGRTGAEDLELYCRLAPVASVGVARQTLIDKRWHRTNMSQDYDRMRPGADRALRRADELLRGRHRALRRVVTRKRADMLRGWAHGELARRNPACIATVHDLLRLTPVDPRAWSLWMRAAFAFGIHRTETTRASHENKR